MLFVSSDIKTTTATVEQSLIGAVCTPLTIFPAKTAKANLFMHGILPICHSLQYRIAEDFIIPYLRTLQK